MIKNLAIKRFKQLVDFHTELKWLNVLVGANNSGKSSVLQAIHFFVSVAQSRQLVDGWKIGEQENDVKYSGTIAPQQIIYTPAQDMMSVAHGGNLTQNPDNSIVVSFLLKGNAEGILSIRRGKNRNIALEMKGRDVVGRLEKIEEPFSIYVPGLAGLARTESYVARGNLLRSLARGDSNLILRNVLYDLHENRGKWKLFVEDLTDIFPDTYLKMKSKPEIDEYVDVSVENIQGTLPIDYAGTGLLQTIQILAYINLFAPAVTLLDEPDSHLHPNNQKALAKKLSQLAEERRTQVIIATHSRHILDALGSRAKYIWVRGGKGQEVSGHIEVLKDLGALDGAEGLLAKGIKYVVISEDADTRPLELLISQYVAIDHVQILSYKGCSNTQAVESLGKFIHEVSKGTEVVVHRDSDYLDDDFKAYWINNYMRMNFKVFFTSGVNIETYFCRLAHLRKVNRGYSEIINEIYADAFNENELKFRGKAKRGRNETRSLRVKAGLSSASVQEIDEWAKTIDIRQERWINGKELLPILRAKFKAKTGAELKVFGPSPSLYQEEDEKLFKPAIVRRAQRG